MPTALHTDWQQQLHLVRQRASKNRLNVLDLLRAGHSDYVIKELALAYMRGRGLSGPVRRAMAYTRKGNALPITSPGGHLISLASPSGIIAA